VSPSGYSDSIHVHALDYWALRFTAFGIVALQLLIINDLSLGPPWLAPALAVSIMIPISIEMTIGQRLAHRATSEAEWEAVRRHRMIIWRLVLALAAVISIANGFALFELIKALLASKPANGRALLLDALNIWATNVMVFAIWFWALDRGGPVMSALGRATAPEFAFQFPPPGPTSDAGGRTMAGFIDYLFLSFTNSTAFSPADTLPLSERMKLLMMLEASISLLTVALVAARAVGILS
jgi:hypothetical protein